MKVPASRCLFVVLGMVVLVSSGCGGKPQPAVVGGIGTPLATTATTATTLPIVQNRADDKTKAERALVAPDVMSSAGWTAKPAATPSSSSSPFINCPNLAALHPAFAAANSQVVVVSPGLVREDPPGEFAEAIVVFPTAAEASALFEALRDVEAEECIKSLIGTKRGTPRRPTDAHVTAWKLGIPDDDRVGDQVGFDMTVTTTTDSGEPQDVHVGFWFVRVEQAVALAIIFGAGELGADATEAANATTSGLITAFA